MEKESRKYKIVAFIPLRKGSKSIFLKNIKRIAGKPLAFWATKAAIDCSLIDKVFVSTDSEIIKKEISRVIKSKKLKIIGRSKETATDSASTESSMLEFAKNYRFEHIILIQATSPLLETYYLKEGLKRYLKLECDSLLSVARQKRFIWEEKAGFVRPINYNPLKRPLRQKFEGFLAENGAFYITSKERLLKTKSRISGKISAFEMPERTYFEMDMPYDWVIIENLLKKRNKQKKSKKNDKITKF